MRYLRTMGKSQKRRVFNVMSKKIVTCKTCGAQIAKNSPTCPACGAKKKGKPFWVVFVVLGLFIFIYSLGSTTSENAPVKVDTSTSTSQEQTIIYTPYSVGQLVDDLEKNALKAEKTYQNQYLELTGALSVIDSDGDYIGIYPSDNLFALTGVQCFMKTNKQVEQVMEMSIGDTITVRGKITAIGKIWGYSMKIDEFVI